MYSRGRQLDLFIAFCEARSLTRPEEVTKPVLEAYQRHLFHLRKTSGAPLSIGTQLQRLVSVRALFKWLARRNLLLWNPASELELPTLPRRLRPGVTGLRLLVVEDDDDLRDTLSVMLELRGHRVLAAADGTSAVQLAADSRPEAALVDLGLPDISGHEVARRIRAIRSLDPILLIALTGFSAEAERVAAIEAGFDEFLVKPVAAAELERVLAAR